MRVLYPGRTGIWKCWFLWRKEERRTREKSLEQGENQQQTQPTYETEPESNPGHISGRRALSPLRQSPPPPPFIPADVKRWSDTTQQKL